MSKIVLLFGVAFLSLTSFLAAHQFATYTINATALQIYSISAVASLIPFLMIRFCLLVVWQVMDATTVCYVIDVDTRKCHQMDVHKVFSAAEDAAGEQSPPNHQMDAELGGKKVIWDNGRPSTS